MKTYSNLWQYVSKFFLECKMFRIKVVEKVKKTHFMFRNFFRLWYNVVNRGGAIEATGDNIIRRMRFACWISKATRTPKRPQILTHAPMHAPTRTRTECVILFFFLFFHGNNSFVNAPQCYVICTVRVFSNVTVSHALLSGLCDIAGFSCGWLRTDISGLPIGAIFKGQGRIAWPLIMGQIGLPETSLWNHLKPRNNSEGGRIWRVSCELHRHGYVRQISQSTAQECTAICGLTYFVRFVNRISSMMLVKCGAYLEGCWEGRTDVIDRRLVPFPYSPVNTSAPLGSNPGLCSEKPESNYFKYDILFSWTCYSIRV